MVLIELLTFNMCKEKDHLYMFCNIIKRRYCRPLKLEVARNSLFNSYYFLNHSHGNSIFNDKTRFFITLIFVMIYNSVVIQLKHEGWYIKTWLFLTFGPRFHCRVSTVSFLIVVTSILPLHFMTEWDYFFTQKSLVFK